MRVIVRAEQPHPGAQLRFTDSNGHRLNALATNIAGGQLADLELRYRRRARCEDRIRAAKDTGLHNLPLKDSTQKQIWVAIVQLATELTVWMQILAFSGTPAHTYEPQETAAPAAEHRGPDRPPSPPHLAPPARQHTPPRPTAARTEPAAEPATTDLTIRRPTSPRPRTRPRAVEPDAHPGDPWSSQPKINKGGRK